MPEWISVKDGLPEDGKKFSAGTSISAMATIIVCFRHTVSDNVITKCGAAKLRTESVRE